MNTYNLRSSPRKKAVESWDEDADIQGLEGLQLRHPSSSLAHGLRRSPRTRESTSSRVSSRSGEDENEWQLLVGEDEDASNAIRHAHNAGVPIPANIPASALLGGTIRKLGTKKKASKDNYDDDIELPMDLSQGLKLSLANKTEYPSTLRNVSGNATQTRTPPETPTRQTRKAVQAQIQAFELNAGENFALNKYRDDDDEDVFDVPTIKVGKVRTPLKSAGFYAMPQGSEKPDTSDDVMQGIEFPDTASPLRLSTRKAQPVTPAHLMPADLEIDTNDVNNSAFSSSITGNRPSGRSERSSSVTAHSPSVFSPTLSSSFTMESEEDGLEGLVLPDGPVNFSEALKRRLESVSPDQAPAKRPEMQAPPKDDFFDDLDIDDGKAFEPGKRRLNRHVKLNNGKNSPSRKGATTITFTNRQNSATTRIPKPSPMERPRSKMETISENGPAPQPRRTQSRLLNHSTQPSLSSLHTSSTPSLVTPSVPSTPTKKPLTTRSSTQSMRQEPTSSSSQLLKAKRSLPTMRNQASPARPQSIGARPPSRTDKNLRPLTTRPKTPVESLGSAKGHIPFIPPGSSKGVSYHIGTRPSKVGPRPTSSESNENVAFGARPSSRLSNSQYRPKTPSIRPDIAPDSLTRQAIVKKTMTKPWRRRAFGDGTELDGFDDLVTSKDQEAKYIRQPREAQSSHSLRSVNRTSTDLRKHFSAQNLSAIAQGVPEIKPVAPAQISPPRQQAVVPGFARDTAASRLAREQRVSRLNPQPNRHPHASDGNLNARFKDHLTVKTASPAPRQLRRTKKPKQPLNLIKNLGGNAEVKPQKGMSYNAKECKWEGNEADLDNFDAPPVDHKVAATPVPGSGAASPTRRMNNATPKPALIAPFGQKKDVVHQVGGMVFDPSKMCWLKVDTKYAKRGRHNTLYSATMSASSTGAGARSVTTTTTDDDEDPFAGIADLEDERKVGVGAGSKKVEDRRRTVSGAMTGDFSSDEDWGIGEDFDVGPEFVRRQKKEEQRMERKMVNWSDRANAKPKTSEDVFNERKRMMRLLCGLPTQS